MRPDATRPALARLQILAVEDNEKNMKLFRDVLQATGLSNTRGFDRGTSTHLASVHQHALVLMDIQLPDMDHPEALRRLRIEIVRLQCQAGSD